jgi:PAS domain S-box-containing protein
MTQHKAGEWCPDALKAPPLDTILAQCAFNAASLFDSSMCILLLTEGDNLVIRAATGLDLTTLEPKCIPIGKSLSGCLVMGGCAQVFVDVSQHLKTIPGNLETYYSGSLASVPLVLNDRVLGLLNLCRPSPGKPFSKDDLTQIVACASHIALVVACQQIAVHGTQKLEERETTIERMNDRLCREIVALEHAEQALKESYEDYRQIIERGNDGIVIIQDSLIKYANPRLLDICGYPCEEVIGVRFFDFLCEDQIEAAVSLCAKSQAGELTCSNHETAIRHKDGRRVEVDLSWGIIAHQKKPAALVTVRDITQRKSAEQALRASESKYRTLVENIPQRIFTKDRNSVYLSCNQNYARDLGTTPKEIAGRTDYDFHPTELADKYRTDDRRVMESGKTETIEERYVQNGQELWVQTIKTPIREAGGSVTGILGIFWDITERKRAENALRESEQKLRAIFDQTFQFIGLMTPDGALIDANRSSLKFSGVEESEVLGKPFWETPWWKHSPELQDKLRAAVKKAAKGEFIRFEATHQAADGSLHTIDFSLKPVTDEAGSVVFLIPEGRDVTEDTYAREALLESERKYRQIIESIGKDYFFYRHTIDGIVTYVSPSISQMLGHSQEEFQTHYAEYLTDNPVNDEAIKMDSLVANGVPLPQHEIEIYDKIRTKHWLEVTEVPVFDKDGKVIAADGVAHDITERKRAEEALRTSLLLWESSFNAINDVVCLLDSENRITRCNVAMQKITGKPPDGIIGQTIWELLHGTSGPSEDCPVIRARQTLHRESTVMTLGDRWVTATVDPILDDAGDFAGAILIIQDITERKRAEDERAKMHTQLLQGQKLESIGQLAAGIAHEINTPTQYIGDNTRFLQEALVPLCSLLVKYRELLEAEKMGRATGEIVREIEALAESADLEFLLAEIPKAIEQSLDGMQRISTIVGAMKEFSHPSPAEKVPVDINRCLATTITLSRNEWKYVANMVTDFDESLPRVPCIQAEFNQAILNLVVNAAHAIAGVVGTSDEKGEIKVTSRRDGDWVEVRVADTGTGIPEAIRSRIFEPFFTTKEVGKGTGQGLAISRSAIVDKLGGTITFETELGRGTAFIVRLPFRPSSEAHGVIDETADSLCR